MRVVRIELPDWMLADLRARAQLKGVDVVELLRRAASLERFLYGDADNEVVVRNRATGREVVVRLREAHDAG